MDFIAGRYPADERATMVALPDGAPRLPRTPRAGGLPVVHVVIPSDFRDVNFNARRTDFSYTWANMPGGLDGIALDLPALKVAPTHGEWIPLNVQIKDPIWPLRNLLDVSFSVKPGDGAHDLVRHARSHPAQRSAALPHDRLRESGVRRRRSRGRQLRLIFKPLQDAAREHVADRFTQVRDNYAQLLEERPNTRRLDLYTRLEGDLTDLLRVDPDHVLGRAYWYDFNREQPRPAVALASPPAGVPLWAFRQVENLRLREASGQLVHRPSPDRERRVRRRALRRRRSHQPVAGHGAHGRDAGEDSASRCCARWRRSTRRACSRTGSRRFRPTSCTATRKASRCSGRRCSLDYASPTHLERAMETSLGIERVTGINSAGHRHIRSSYFSGTTIAEEGVWGWSKPSSYLFLHPALELVEFNGSPRVRKYLLELADALLAHRKQDANGSYAIRATVEFATDRDLPQLSDRAWPLMWAAFRWTGDRKYLQPFLDAGPRGLPVAPGKRARGPGDEGAVESQRFSPTPAWRTSPGR